MTFLSDFRGIGEIGNVIKLKALGKEALNTTVSVYFFPEGPLWIATAARPGFYRLFFGNRVLLAGRAILHRTILHCCPPTLEGIGIMISFIPFKSLIPHQVL